PSSSPSERAACCRRGAGGRGSRGAADSSAAPASWPLCLSLRLVLLPVRAEHLGHPDVVPAAVAIELFAKDAHLAVAGFLQGALRCLVVHECARAHLVKVQLAER